MCGAPLSAAPQCEDRGVLHFLLTCCWETASASGAMSLCRMYQPHILKALILIFHLNKHISLKPHHTAHLEKKNHSIQPISSSSPEVFLGCFWQGNAASPAPWDQRYPQSIVKLPWKASLRNYPLGVGGCIQVMCSKRIWTVAVRNLIEASFVFGRPIISLWVDVSLKNRAVNTQNTGCYQHWELICLPLVTALQLLEKIKKL